MIENFLLIFSFLVAGISTVEPKEIELPAIFGDNMIMQQKMKVPIWGKATANERVEITSSWGEKIATTARADGKWETKLKTPEAGGPYNIIITGKGSEITFKNVLIGEVWVCSGQSNMAMPLIGWPPDDTVKNFKKEIRNADYPEIRCFTVSRSVSIKPEKDCEGSWQKCSPETAKNFSAAAYFFARKIHQELEIPVGLIHSSWGGTPAESWTSPEYLGKVNAYSDFTANTDSFVSKRDKYTKWLNTHPTITPTSDVELAGSGVHFGDTTCYLPNFDDSSWKEMNLPAQWENTELGIFDGVVWFRKGINLPESWEDKDLMLKLGPIDDIDITYFNGKRVGAHEGMGFWATERKYKIPSKLIRKGENVIAVRVIDLQMGGGILGEKKQLKIYPIGEANTKPKTLSGAWKYLPVAQLKGDKFYLFGTEENDFYTTRPEFKGVDAYTPTALYNAMIAPIIPYGIRGAIWYQGEANVGRHEQYQKLFPTLIESWRAAWNLGKFSFYFVQIAPYAYNDKDDPVSAKLREAQLKTMKSVPNTGMVVTLDIGNANKIHPANKQEVGRRLALWALAKDYGKDIVYSGPVYKSMEKENNKIRLYFDHVGGGLVLKNRTLSEFKIAGEDRIFVDAKTSIDGENVIVYSAKVENPVAVRYAFTNGAEASLFNKKGLPASSFRTDDWEK